MRYHVHGSAFSVGWVCDFTITVEAETDSDAQGIVMDVLDPLRADISEIEEAPDEV